MYFHFSGESYNDMTDTEADPSSVASDNDEDEDGAYFVYPSVRVLILSLSHVDRSSCSQLCMWVEMELKKAVLGNVGCI